MPWTSIHGLKEELLKLVGDIESMAITMGSYSPHAEPNQEYYEADKEELRKCREKFRHALFMLITIPDFKLHRRLANYRKFLGQHGSAYADLLEEFNKLKAENDELRFALDELKE